MSTRILKKKKLLAYGGENLRNRDEEIRQYNYNTYMNQSADLCGSSLLALKTNNYIRAHILAYY